MAAVEPPGRSEPPRARPDRLRASWFGRWLRPSLPHTAGQLEVRVHHEQAPTDRQALVDQLGKEILRNYVAPGELEVIFRDLGVPEVADHLARNKFPNDRRVRLGDFGEVLAGRLLRDARWCVPILKLRYKQRPDQAVQGADVVAFRLQENPPVVAVPEAKARTSRDYRLEREAQDSLDRSVRDLPQTITFVVARLVQEGKEWLAAQIGSLLINPYELERSVVLVHENAGLPA